MQETQEKIVEIFPEKYKAYQQLLFTYCAFLDPEISISVLKILCSRLIHSQLILKEENVEQNQEQQALVLSKLSYSEKKEIIITLSNLFSVLFLTESTFDKNLLVSHSEKIIEHAKNNLLDEEKAIVVLHYNLGNLYQESKELKQAVVHQQAVISYYVKRYKNKNKILNFAEELVSFSQNLGLNYRAINEFDKAVESFEQAYQFSLIFFGQNALVTCGTKDNLEIILQERMYRSQMYQVCSHLGPLVRLGIGLRKCKSVSSVIQLVGAHLILCLTVPTVGRIGEWGGWYSKENGEYWASWVVDGILFCGDPVGYGVSKVAERGASNIASYCLKKAKIRNNNLRALTYIAASEIGNGISARLIPVVNKQIKYYRSTSEVKNYKEGEKIIKRESGEEVSIIREKTTSYGRKEITFSSGETEIIDGKYKMTVKNSGGTEIIGDGYKGSIKPSGDQVHEWQNKKVFEKNLGENVSFNEDGWTSPDGIKIQENSSGSITLDIPKFGLINYLENNSGGWETTILASGEKIVKSKTGRVFQMMPLGFLIPLSNSELFDKNSEPKSISGYKINAPTLNWEPIKLSVKSRTLPTKYQVQTSPSKVAQECITYFNEKVQGAFIKYFNYKIRLLELEALLTKFKNLKKIAELDNKSQEYEKENISYAEKLTEERGIEELTLEIKEKKEKIKLEEKEIKLEIINRLYELRKEDDEGFQRQIQYLESEVKAIAKINFHIPVGSERLREIIKKIIKNYPEWVQDGLVKLFNEFSEQMDALAIEEKELINLEEELEMKERKPNKPKITVVEDGEFNVQGKESDMPITRRISPNTTARVLGLTDTTIKGVSNVTVAYYGYKAVKEKATADKESSEKDLKKAKLRHAEHKESLAHEQEKETNRHQEKIEELKIAGTKVEREYSAANKKMDQKYDYKMKQLELEIKNQTLQTKLEESEREKNKIEGELEKQKKEYDKLYKKYKKIKKESQNSKQTSYGEHVGRGRGIHQANQQTTSSSETSDNVLGNTTNFNNG